MYYKDFVKGYDEAVTGESGKVREYVASHVVMTYVKYAEKMVMAQNIVNSSMTTKIKVGDEEREVFQKNTAAQYLYFVLRVLQSYTDIEFDQAGLFDVYDALNERGIWQLLFMPQQAPEGYPMDSIIPQKEYQEWQMVLRMAEADYMENRRSLTSFLEGKLDAVKLYLEAMSDGVLDVAKKAAEQADEVVNDGDEGA